MVFGERWATSFRVVVPVLPANDLFQAFLLLARGLFFLLFGWLRLVVGLLGVFGLGRSIAASAVRFCRGVAACWIRFGCRIASSSRGTCSSPAFRLYGSVGWRRT